MEPSLDTAEWLRSPVGAAKECLPAHSEVELAPYYGKRRKLLLRHTSYLIGSGEHCDIRIDDPFVSTEHAKLRLDERLGYRVEDLGSRNGIWLNGLRIESALLPRQGNLRLGRSRLAWKEKSETEILVNERLIAVSASMRELVRSLRSAAESRLPILLLGETGTGKDVLARLIHEWSGFSGGKFVPLNAAQAEGSLVDSELFGHKKGAYTGSESHRTGALLSAHRGTLFLDEIGDLPLGTQLKLLRALETGEVKALGADSAETSDFRLVSATSRDLAKSLSAGDFRLDFYYRIAGFIARVPPLRERPEDILALTHWALAPLGLAATKEAEAKLLSALWPGNVRELLSALERAALEAKCAGSQAVEAEFLALDTDIAPRAEEESVRTLDEVEKRAIASAVERTGGSRLRAAKELGIARSTLFAKMKKYGIRGYCATKL